MFSDCLKPAFDKTLIIQKSKSESKLHAILSGNDSLAFTQIMYAKLVAYTEKVKHHLSFIIWSYLFNCPVNPYG